MRNCYTEDNFANKRKYWDEPAALTVEALDNWGEQKKTDVSMKTFPRKCLALINQPYLTKWNKTAASTQEKHVS
jgi:hypothetical protein